jgi:uncharacterized protein YcbK (DUF882 family)
MKFGRFGLLAFGVAFWFAGPAAAQFGLSRDGSRGVAASQVVQREDVQQELKLSPVQIKKLHDVAEKTRQQRVDEFGELAKLDPKARDRKRVELVKKITQQESAALKDILTEDQLARLRQLTYQLAYVQAFRNQEVEAALKLDSGQTEKITAHMRGAIDEMRKLFQETRDGVGEGQEQAAKLRDKAYEQCLAVLSAEQKKEWERLQGKPFEFRKIERVQKVANPVRANQNIAVPDPAPDKRDLKWVSERAEAWLPAADERKMDQIGWADEIIPALRLAQKHNRPVFMFTLDGDLSLGRC